MARADYKSPWNNYSGIRKNGYQVVGISPMEIEMEMEKTGIRKTIELPY
jgi:hypothetical protein